MSHLAIRMQVILPDSRYHSEEKTENSDPNRLDRRINSYLKKQSFAIEDVVTEMSVFNRNTGVLIRFTFWFETEWFVEVRVRPRYDCPYVFLYTRPSYEGTREIVIDYTKQYF